MHAFRLCGTASPEVRPLLGGPLPLAPFLLFHQPPGARGPGSESRHTESRGRSGGAGGWVTRLVGVRLGERGAWPGVPPRRESPPPPGLQAPGWGTNGERLNLVSWHFFRASRPLRAPGREAREVRDKAEVRAPGNPRRRAARGGGGCGSPEERPQDGGGPHVDRP